MHLLVLIPLSLDGLSMYNASRLGATKCFALVHELFTSYDIHLFLQRCALHLIGRTIPKVQDSSVRMSCSCSWRSTSMHYPKHLMLTLFNLSLPDTQPPSPNHDQFSFSETRWERRAEFHLVQLRHLQIGEFSTSD
jgi:hypothetical protein